MKIITVGVNSFVKRQIKGSGKSYSLKISFKEMEEKIPNFRNPEKYISQRIENEIKESDQKYRLFVR